VAVKLSLSQAVTFSTLALCRPMADNDDDEDKAEDDVKEEAGDDNDVEQCRRNRPDAMRVDRTVGTSMAERVAV